MKREQGDVLPGSQEPHKSRRGLSRIWHALFYSMAGLRAAWNAEAAFRQELALAAVLIPVAALIPATLTQKALLISSVLLVLMVELVNSAVESTVDRISMETHELAKRAKDAGSAAVFVALSNLLIVWVLVLAELVLS